MEKISVAAKCCNKIHFRDIFSGKMGKIAVEMTTKGGLQHEQKMVV